MRKVIRRKGYFGGRDGSSKRQVSVVYRTLYTDGYLGESDRGGVKSLWSSGVEK